MLQIAENSWELQRRFEREARRNELVIAGIVVATSIFSLVGTLSAMVAFIAISHTTLNEFVAYVLISMAGLLPVGLVLYIIQFIIPKLFERRQLQRIIAGQDVTADLPAHALAHVEMASVIFPLLLGIFLNVVHVFFPEIGLLEMLLGYPMILFAFVYHHVPNCRRSVKYAAFFTGSVLLSGGYFALLSLPKRSISNIAFLSLTTLVSILVFVLTRQLIQPTADLVRGEPSTRRAISWRRFSMAVGPGPGFGLLIFTMIRLVPIVGDLFWAARIWSKERLAHRPVLFLRSFSHQGAAALLAKGIAPALSRTSVMVALVHPSQTTAALNKRTHEAWAPLTIGVSDEKWQEWFLDQLSNALAVVADASEFTPLLRWEIENSVRVLGSDHVLALVPEDATYFQHDCEVLKFAPKRPATVKKELKIWIDRIVHQDLIKTDS